MPTLFLGLETLNSVLQIKTILSGGIKYPRLSPIWNFSRNYRVAQLLNLYINRLSRWLLSGQRIVETQMSNLWVYASCVSSFLAALKDEIKNLLFTIPPSSHHSVSKNASSAFPLLIRAIFRAHPYATGICVVVSTDCLRAGAEGSVVTAIAIACRIISTRNSRHPRSHNQDYTEWNYPTCQQHALLHIRFDPSSRAAEAQYRLSTTVVLWTALGKFFLWWHEKIDDIPCPTGETTPRLHFPKDAFKRTTRNMSGAEQLAIFCVIHELLWWQPV